MKGLFRSVHNVGSTDFRCMARKGMNPKTLQYLMGHSDISVTLNVYTHLGLQDAVEEMTRLQDLERAREEQERMDGENSAADDEGSSMVI